MEFRWLLFLSCLLLTAVVSASAQAPIAQEGWQTAVALPGIDFSGLTDAQKQKALEMLREQGCTEAQGFYFSRPVPASEIDALFTRDVQKAAVA